MNDFYKMSSMMKNLFPSDPESDKQALKAMAGNLQESVAPTKDYVQESVEVPQGSMPLDLGMSDFAKLAGIKEQKDGDYARGSDATPKMSKPSSTGEQPHPLKDKLVGEVDVLGLTPGASTVGGAINPEVDDAPLIARGLKKAANGEVLEKNERTAIAPYVELMSELMTNPAFRNNLIAMDKALKSQKNDDTEDEKTDESGLQYYTGVKKHGKEYMKKAAAAGRAGASQEELGRLKDKYSKAEKNKKTESIKERLYKELNQRKI